MTIELTQSEANMLLRALEEIQALDPSPGDEAAAKLLWERIFDLGLKAGFGKETHDDS